MRSTIEITVPSTVNVNESNVALQSEFAIVAMLLFARLFGGGNRTEATGFWVSPSVGLVQESVVVISSTTSEDGLAQALPEVIALAERIACEMAQECVLVTVNGELRFVTPPAMVASAAA